MSTYKERMLVELDELTAKLEKIREFIDCAPNINQGTMFLICEQEKAMARYVTVLHARIELD